MSANNKLEVKTVSIKPNTTDIKVIDNFINNQELCCSSIKMV